MSKLISKLPKRIRERALECQAKDKFSDKHTDDLGKAFVWNSTKEKKSIWVNVYSDNYQPFYTFHNIKPHGGKREGAKRPLKYGEETTQATYYPPKSKKPIIDKMVKDKLKEWVVNK